MMRIALLKDNVIRAVINARSGEPYGVENTDWIDMEGRRGGPGWTWNGRNTAPPEKVQRYRKIVTPAEFVDLFPPAAYMDIKNNLVGTNAAITKMYEYAFLKDTINLNSPRLPAALAILIQESSLTQEDADKILQGVPE
jgi:hypothetical protein